MTTTGETTSASDSEIDDAILAVLQAAPGGAMAWSDLRDQLPASQYWVKVEALCRAQAEGLVHVEKVDGLGYVSLAPVLPTPRRRP